MLRNLPIGDAVCDVLAAEDARRKFIRLNKENNDVRYNTRLHEGREYVSFFETPEIAYIMLNKWYWLEVPKAYLQDCYKLTLRQLMTSEVGASVRLHYGRSVRFAKMFDVEQLVKDNYDFVETIKQDLSMTTYLNSGNPDENAYYNHLSLCSHHYIGIHGTYYRLGELTRHDLKQLAQSQKIKYTKFYLEDWQIKDVTNRKKELRELIAVKQQELLALVTELSEL